MGYNDGLFDFSNFDLKYFHIWTVFKNRVTKLNSLPDVININIIFVDKSVKEM